MHVPCYSSFSLSLFSSFLFSFFFVFFWLFPFHWRNGFIFFLLTFAERMCKSFSFFFLPFYDDTFLLSSSSLHWKKKKENMVRCAILISEGSQGVFSITYVYNTLFWNWILLLQYNILKTRIVGTWFWLPLFTF